MILLIRRKQLSAVIAFLLTAATVLSLAVEKPAGVKTAAYAGREGGEMVILDAGHGGSDGGAVSASGTAESGINLLIVLRLRDLFCLMGHRVVLTRCDEASLADPDSGTLRSEKVSDMKNRVMLINHVANGILLSIHQNMLPGYPNVRGAQVFYGQVDGSAARAELVQQALNSTINAGNEKKARPIGGDIYIMAHSERPALLVECGFLSNPKETQQLLMPNHQIKLAVAICCGYLQYQ